MQITLSSDDSIVLFEFLSRFENDEKLNIKHISKGFVLSKIHGQMETTINEPFDINWSAILLNAQKRIATENGLAT